MRSAKKQETKTKAPRKQFEQKLPITSTWPGTKCEMPEFRGISHLLYTFLFRGHEYRWPDSRASCGK